MTFVQIDDLTAKGITLSERHLRRMEQRGEFPARVFLSPRRCLGWPADEIDAWLSERVSARKAV